MTDCIFCRIAEGVLPSKKVYEDDRMLAFWDLNPKCPVHVLLIPKAHVDSLAAVGEGHTADIAHIFAKLPAIADSLGLGGQFRVVSNCGESAGQTVKHLHFHLLGGREMGLDLG